MLASLKRSCLPTACLTLAAVLSLSSPAAAVWNKIAFASDRDHSGKYAIYVMNTGGGAAEKIVDVAGGCRHPRISPDGLSIVFQNDGPRSICVVDADGSNLRTLAYATYTDFAMPEWSPDGTRIVCQGGGSYTNIYVMNADGSGLTRLTTGDYDDWSPTWSPDGSKIAFVSDRFSDGISTYQSIYLMNADGTNLTRVTPGVGDAYKWLAWSPKTNTLLSTLPVGGDPYDYNTALVSIHSDGTGLQYLTADTPSPSPQSRLDAWSPSWSYDGNKVLYCSDRNGTAVAVYLTGPGGGNGGVITDTPVWNVDPHWGKAGLALSPCGTGAFVSTGVAPSRGGPATEFTFKIRYRHTGNERYKFCRLLVWGPDNKQIEGSPFTLSQGNTTYWPAGVIFTKKLTLATHGTYHYQFAAGDGRNTVRWPATAKAFGPVVDRASVLSYAGATGYTADGVEPDSGAAGGSFTFKVKYKDADGDPCTAMNLLLLAPGGGFDPGSPYAMTRVGTNWVKGVVYYVTLPLSTVGAYAYSFSYANAYGGANWPTSWPSGPTVTAASPLAISAARAGQAGLAATVSFTLSAPAEVSATVLNLAGRPVAQLPAEAFGAGSQTLSWNTRGSSGVKVPAGQYLVRLRARTPDGTCTEALAPLTVRR